MTRDDIIRMALEALEDVPYMSNKDDYDRLDKVISVLRAALEAPQPQSVAWPEGYELHELPADYTGRLWIEGQVRRLFDYANGRNHE